MLHPGENEINILIRELLLDLLRAKIRAERLIQAARARGRVGEQSQPGKRRRVGLVVGYVVLVPTVGKSCDETPFANGGVSFFLISSPRAAQSALGA